MGTHWVPCAMLAQGDLLNPALAPAGKTSGLVLSNLLIVLAVGAGLALLLALWFFLIRKRGGGRRRRHHHWHTDEAPDEPGATDPGAAEDASEPASRGRHRHSRRRMRREHRGRNPTLADTGGLPPRREETGPQAGSP